MRGWPLLVRLPWTALRALVRQLYALPPRCWYVRRDEQMTLWKFLLLSVPLPQRCFA